MDLGFRFGRYSIPPFFFLDLFPWQKTRNLCRHSGCAGITTEYSCEDGYYSVSSSSVTISNPDSPSSSETGVNPGIMSWKSTCLIELDVRKPLVVSMSQRSEEMRLYNLVQNLTISNPGLKAVSSNASTGWTVRFSGVMIWVFWKREPRRINRPNFTSQLANFFSVFTSLVYSLCNQHVTVSSMRYIPRSALGWLTCNKISRVACLRRSGRDSRARTVHNCFCYSEFSREDSKYRKSPDPGKSRAPQIICSEYEYIGEINMFENAIRRAIYAAASGFVM